MIKQIYRWHKNFYVENFYTNCGKVILEKNVQDRKIEEFIYKISYRYIVLFSSNEIWIVCIVLL